VLDALLNAKIFSGSSHPKLAGEIADCLGLTLGKINIGSFPDGETSLEIMESVRGYDIFVVQTIAKDPNHYLMELLIIIDALKRASARTITAVIPYFGYCRQDRRAIPRVPITAKLVADMLTCAGADHILTVDLHAGQLEGFFDIPVDNIIDWSSFIETIKKMHLHRLVVVAPDAGSVKRARAYARYLDTDIAIIDKLRINAYDVEAAALIGDVEGKDVLLADDMCSTAGTLVSAAKACREKGANRIVAVVTHGLLVGDSLKKIANSPIEALLVGNTVPVDEQASLCSQITIVSVASSLAQAIRCILTKDPL